MKTLDKVFKQIARVLNTISAVVLFITLFFTGLNTVLRYAFGVNIAWADEFSKYFYILALFLLIIDMEYDNSALSIGFLYDKMKVGSVGKAILDIIKWAVSIFTACIFINSGYKSLQQAMKFNSVGMTTGIPYSYIYGTLLFSIVIWLIYLICKPLIAAGRKGE